MYLRGWGRAPLGAPVRVGVGGGGAAGAVGVAAAGAAAFSTAANAASVERDAEPGPDNPDGPVAARPPETGNEPWKAQLDAARELLVAGSPLSALGLLEALAAQMRAAPPPEVSAASWQRLYGNAGAALFRVGRIPEARVAFETALRHAPVEPGAQAGTLANLARSAYLLGDREATARYAWRAVGANADDAQTWALLVELATGAGAAPVATEGPDAPPAAVRASAEFRLGEASAALQRGDYARAAAVLRDTLAEGRPADRLYLLAYALMQQAYAPWRAAGAPPEGAQATQALAEAEALAGEALAALPATEYSTLHEQLLLLRANVRRLLGRLDDAADDAQRALRLHPDPSPGYWRAACTYAAVRLDQGRPDDVYGVLDLVPARDRPAAVFVLRARADAALGRRDAVRRAVDDALAAPVDVGPDASPNAEADDEAVREVVFVCIELALEAGLVDLAASTLNARVKPRLGPDGGWLYDLFAGRIAFARGDDAAGVDALRRAADRADDAAARPRVRFELAGRLAQLGRFAEAVAAYEAGDAWGFGDAVRPGYIAALLEAGQVERADARLRELEAQGALPVWALSAAAALAELRDDLEAAARHLARLLAARPESVNAHLRLANAYLRLEQPDAAAPVLRAVVGRPDLTPRERLSTAGQLFGLGDLETAVREAFHALRAAAASDDEAELQQAYVRLLTHAEQRGAVDPRGRVGPDTRASLRRVSGPGRAHYDLVAEGPADADRREYLASDPAVAPLLGRAPGDVVTLAGKRGAPTAFRVVRVDHLAAIAYGRLMRAFTKRPPAGGGFWTLSLGTEGTVGHLMPFVAQVHAQQRGEEAAFAAFAGPPLFPVGALATMLGRNLYEAYALLVARAGRVQGYAQYVQTEYAHRDGYPAALRAAASTAPLVLTRTALATAQQLSAAGVDLFGLLERLGRPLLAPQSLLDELGAEVQGLQAAKRKGMTRVSAAPTGYTIYETSAEALAEDERRLVALRDWVRRTARVTGRSLAALSKGAGALRRAIGASSMDAIDAAAAGQGVLFADDLGLRALAAQLHAPDGCSTWAVVTTAENRGLLDGPTARRAVTTLVAMRHYFVPLTPALLVGLVRDEAHQITAATRPVFDRLSDPDLDLDSAVEAVTEVLREVALSGLGFNALGDVTQACVVLLTQHRRVTPTLNKLAQRAEARLHLLPDALAQVLERMARFRESKRAGGSLQ